MLGRAAAGFVVATTYALSANAILLPPGVNAIDNSLLTNGAQSTRSQSIRIPCAECAFSTKQEHADGVDGGDEVFGIEGGANEILLNFSTSEDNKRIELNGAPIYPPLAYEQPVVHQVPAGGNDVKVPLRVTSSGLVMDAEQPDEEREASLVTIRWSVFGLEKHTMQLQAVKIGIFKYGDELVLIEVELDEEDKQAPSPPHHGRPGFRPHFGGPPFHGPPLDMMNKKECNTLPASVCRFKHVLEAKIASVRHKKPCPGSMGPPHGRFPSHGRPPFRGEHSHPHHGRPHDMRPWTGRHHHHHHVHHHWAGAFMRGFVAVLIPVAAGISVGLTVSLIGVLIGRLITWIWTRNARRSELAREAEFAEEGKGLMLAAEGDNTEALPAYEDAPAYEEFDAKVSF